MSAFVVRLEGTNQIVGFFAADRILDLFWAVDECCDPFSCEYRRVPEGGGVYWAKAGTPKVSRRNDVRVDLRGAELTELLWNVFVDPEDYAWRRFSHTAIEREMRNEHAKRS